MKISPKPLTSISPLGAPDAIGKEPSSPASGQPQPLQQAEVASGAAEHLGGGLPPARLEAELARAAAAIERVHAAALPEAIDTLVDHYADLGRASTAVQAALLSAFDALDPNTGGGAAKPPAAFVDLCDRAMSVLRRAGAAYAHLEPAFSPLVHGGSGWPNQAIEAQADRGDGRPLLHYRNTFKTATTLTVEERHGEYQKRVDKFVAAGGSFEDIRDLDTAALDGLVHRERYDYVMAASGAVRLGTTEGDAKPGHSLLAEGGPELKDEPALLAGEMWALRDSAGDLEVLIVANNSGHFKPAFDDLENALAPLEALGIPKEKIVLFGGPNNLPALFKEIEERCGLEGLGARLPKSPFDLIDDWSAGLRRPHEIRGS